MKTWFLLLNLLWFTPALAETQFYGKISTGVSASHSRLPDGTRFNTSKVEDYDSYIGIRGRIPLGSSGQTHTIWQWEQATPTASTSLRDQWRAKKESNQLSTRADFIETR